MTCGSDLAFPQNWPCQWHIFVQRQVSAGVILVVGVGAKHAAQMKLPSWCGLLIRYALTNIKADKVDSSYRYYIEQRLVRDEGIGTKCVRYAAISGHSSIPFQQPRFLCLKSWYTVSTAHLTSLVAGASWPDAVLMLLVERK